MDALLTFLGLTAPVLLVAIIFGVLPYSLYLQFRAVQEQKRTREAAEQTQAAVLEMLESMKDREGKS